MRKSIILAVLCVAGATLAPAAVAQSSKTQNAVNHVHHRHHAVSEAYAKQTVRPRQPSTPKGECNWPQTNLYNNPC